MARKHVIAGLLGVGLCLTGRIGGAWAAADGKKAFEAKKCISCHSLGSEKGAMAKLGGPLDGIGAKRDAAWLKAYLTDPNTQIPNARMPKQSLNDKELDELVQYLLTVK